MDMANASSCFRVQRSADRFTSDHGWLKTSHSLSFADYYDPANMHWGPLRVFNDDYIAPNQGFPTHHHENMEILTYVLNGKLEHRDTLGSHGVVEGGGVQYMSAGTGVRHSEYNASGEHDLHFIQMWVLPGKRDTPPTYGQVNFNVDERRNTWLTAASGDVVAPIGLTQAATLRLCRLENAVLKTTVRAGRFGFLFIGEGEAAVEGTSASAEPRAMTLQSGDALRMYDIIDLTVSGSAELIFWELPPV